MGRFLTWDSLGASPAQYNTLPPDLTPSSMRLGSSRCWSVSVTGWACTRLAGHSGRHAAGDGERIRAVWS